MAKTSPVITWANPAAITYGVALDATQLNATADVAGSFVYTPAAGTIPDAGSQTLKVDFTPTDSAAYNTATKTVTIIVNKADPVITWSDPAAITYGATVGATQLNAAASTVGSFAYTPASGTQPNAGTQPLKVDFTPTSANYNTATKTVNIIVNKATPVITWTNPGTIYLGTALSSAQLNAIADVAGSFVYTPVVGTVLSAGSHDLKADFTPSGSNYNTATKTVTILVNDKQTPIITWANPTAITYGAALDATQLNATADVAGSFVYTPAAGAILDAGSQPLKVDFTPTDSAAYNTATKTVTIVVNKADPVITWADPAAINYGATVGATQLNATASTVGSFAYTPASGTQPNAGTQPLKVDFTPTSANFNTATKTVSIIVNKADPVITWTNPAAIYTGTVLSSTQLNAIADVAGSFVYTPATGTILAAGSHNLKADFTPSGSNYNTATKTVTILVNDKQTPIITWANPTAITYGAALDATQLNATADVAGSFVYTPAAGTIPDAGSQTLKADFTPTDSAAYNTATAMVTIEVLQADTTPPTLVLYTPVGDAITNNPTLSVTGNVVDAGGIKTLTLANNGTPVYPLVDASTGDFSYAFTLAAGLNNVTANAVDNANNHSQAGPIRITYDPNAPVLTITKPSNDSKIAQSFAEVIGSVSEAVENVTVTVMDKNQIRIDQQRAAMNALSFNATVNLAAGVNTVVVTAVDLAGNTSSESRKVTSDTTKPNVAITDPATDITTTFSSYTITGNVLDLYTSVASVAITVVDTTTSAVIASFTVVPVNGTFAQTISLPEARQYQVTVVATNEVGTASDPVRVNIIKQATWNDVSGQATVLKASPVYNLTNDLYYVTVRTTNKAGNAPLSGKLRLVASNPSKTFKPSSIGLGVPDGYISPTEPFFYIQPDAGSLAAGASITNKITFVPLSPITFGVRVEQLK